MMVVSPHLKAGDLDARHVFLKSYVFRTEAKVGVISDIDYKGASRFPGREKSIEQSLD